MKTTNLSWYKETIMLNCKACNRREICTIKDLEQCAESFEEWLEENAI